MCVILDSSWSHYQPALMMDASFYIRRTEPKRVSNVQNYIGSLLIMYSWAWEKENKSLMYECTSYVHRTYILFYNLLKQWVIYFLVCIIPVKQNSNDTSKFINYLHLLTNHSSRPGFKSSMCYDHNKCRFQYYIGLLSKPLNNYSSQKKPELNQTEKQNIRSFLY